MARGKKAISKCLAKLTWQNPKLWTQLYLPQFFSRAVSGPALLVARVSSSRHFLRRAPPVRDGVRSPPFPPVRDAAALGTNEGFQVAVESFLPPWTAGRHRSPRFVHCRSPIPVSCQFVVWTGLFTLREAKRNLCFPSLWYKQLAGLNMISINRIVLAYYIISISCVSDNFCYVDVLSCTYVICRRTYVDHEGFQITCTKTIGWRVFRRRWFLHFTAARIVRTFSNRKRRRGGSVPGHVVIHRDREGGHRRMFQDYLAGNPTYGPDLFRQR